jgi:hypothetical protein
VSNYGPFLKATTLTHVGVFGDAREFHNHISQLSQNGAEKLDGVLSACSKSGGDQPCKQKRCFAYERENQLLLFHAPRIER